MSEKRFVLDKLYYTIMTPIEKISVGRSYMTYGEVVGCLNEQQETIKQLQGKIKRLNAFLVSKDLAIEYIRWQKGSGDD